MLIGALEAGGAAMNAVPPVFGPEYLIKMPGQAE